MGQGEAILECDARRIVRLVGDVAAIGGSLPVKRSALMNGLALLVGADAWSWIISRAADNDNNPAMAAYLHGGISQEQVGRRIQIMQDRTAPPVEYAKLNQLRHTHKHFTRGWDQLVTPEEWYGSQNRERLDAAGFEHVLYSVRILDNDGFFSGISLERRPGQPNFSARERRMVHITTGEIDWLHFNPSLSQPTFQVRQLSPRLRTVLTLFCEGNSPKQIAMTLGLSANTIPGYMKALYKHFGVTTQTELLLRFFSGDGGDLA